MKAKNSVFMDTLLPLVIMVVLTIGCIVLLSARSKGLGRAGGSYAPGSYTAEAQGMGTVKVTVEVDESSIKSVDLDVSGETPTIGQAAADTLKKQIMDAQSSAIDGVSGASITSSAVKSALMDCLKQAKA